MGIELEGRQEMLKFFFLRDEGCLWLLAISLCRYQYLQFAHSVLINLTRIILLVVDVPNAFLRPNARFPKR